jgi:hypothetical protein
VGWLGKESDGLGVCFPWAQPWGFADALPDMVAAKHCPLLEYLSITYTPQRSRARIC